MTGDPPLDAIGGCQCGSTHVMRKPEADRLRELIGRTEPSVVTDPETGRQAVATPVTIVLHGEP